jgi:hypothetical protein
VKNLITLATCAFLAALPWASAQARSMLDAPLFMLEPGDATPVERVGAVTSKHRIQDGSIPFVELLEHAMQIIRAPADTVRQLSPLQVKLRMPDRPEEWVAFDAIAMAAGGRITLSGRLESRPADYVVLVLSDERLDGRLAVGGRHYLLRKLTGEHFLLEVDPAQLPPEAPPSLPKPSPSQGAGTGVPAHDHPVVPCDHDVAKTLSVLALYTQAASKGAAAAELALNKGDGNPDPHEAITAAVFNALDTGNLALANSKAKTRFGKDIEPVPVPDYVELGDGDQALAALYDPDHPLHEFASEKRAEEGANLVSLVIEHWAYCGAAPVMLAWNTHPDQTAYSVVVRSCLDADHYSLAHELAHSMGSAHDYKNAGVPGLFAFSYGYNDPGHKLSTIMAYECAGCTRQPAYSNPAAGFPSSTSSAFIPSGEDCAGSTADPDCRETDNVDSIDRAACQVSTWK